ncbi:hypothetical protein BH24BAC1_BH24BAC1_37590 [soil metagenome]
MLLLCLLPGPGWSAVSLEGDDSILKKYEILPDQGYTFERIQTDATLEFGKVDSLRPAQANSYWLKIEALNPSSYARPYRLMVWPNFDNTLYYFNLDANAWIAQRAGIIVPADKNSIKGRFPLMLPGRETTTFYVQVNLGTGHFSKAAKPRVELENASVAQERDYFFGAAWAVSLTVLLILFLNNLHLYYRFRDRTVLYFLFAQVGGMLYITAYRNFFNVLSAFQPFTLTLKPDGTTHFYSLNDMCMHLSVAMVLYGGVQMTRHYLQTKTAIPKLDAWLRYALYGYLLFTAVVALVNLSWFYLDDYTLLYDNMLVLLLTGLLLGTSLVAYRRKLLFAPAYLFANALPLLFLMSIATYHVFIGFSNQGQLLLPDLVIVSQALCFSAAIVSRMQTLRENLLAKEEEARQLALDIRYRETQYRELARETKQIQAAFREMESQRKVKELKTEQLSGDIREEQSANKELQDKLETNQRELASTTLYVAQKNAMLAELKRQMEELNKLSPNSQRQELSGIQSLLKTNLYLDDDWNKFKRHFEQVHPDFFKELQAKYPALTKNELRLLSYFHLNLSTKEIAALLNIDPASVRTAKTRLYKKMASVDKGLALKQSDEETNEPTTGE